MVENPENEKEESAEVAAPVLSIYERLLKMQEADPEKEAVCIDGESFAYADVLQEVDLQAAAFTECNVTERTIVALCMPDNLQKLFCTYALNKIGAYPLLIGPGPDAEELETLVRSQGCECLVIMESMLPDYKEMLTKLDPGMVVVCKDGDYFSFAKRRIRKFMGKADDQDLPKDAFYTTYIQMRRFGKEIVTGKLNDTYDWPSAFEEVGPEKEKEIFVPKIPAEQAKILVSFKDEKERKVIALTSEQAEELPEFIFNLIKEEKVEKDEKEEKVADAE